MDEPVYELELAAGEKELERQPFVDGQLLVSDGNSRWARDGDDAVLVVNDQFLRPEEPSNG